MNQLNYEKPEREAIATNSLILKLSLLGCGGLLLIGLLVFTLAQFQTITKADPKEQLKLGNTRRELTTHIQPSEQSQVVIKQPQKPVIIEEGSDAWFCLQNNGGFGCLDRDRFAPNYRIVSSTQKFIKDCGRYLNGMPNC